jgi:hypothetical protein
MRWWERIKATAFIKGKVRPVVDGGFDWHL